MPRILTVCSHDYPRQNLIHGVFILPTVHKPILHVAVHDWKCLLSRIVVANIVYMLMMRSIRCVKSAQRLVG